MGPCSEPGGQEVPLPSEAVGVAAREAPDRPDHPLVGARVGQGRGGQGGVGEAQGSGNFVQNQIKMLERKIQELEAKVDACKRSEGSKFELVNQKNMTPSVLKDGTAFRN